MNQGMKKSIRVGYSFGLTSGITTTLGLIIGLAAGTQSRIAVIGGIITISLADSLSEGFGMHISEEAEEKHSKKEIWESSGATFFSKFIIALTFLIPVYFFNLSIAVILSIIWGLCMITLLSYTIGKKTSAPIWKPIDEHITIAVIVIIITHFVGIGVPLFFS
jgi:VIT1/CCC1 family predicted Fe2+/Mn2+ transporter